MASTPDTPPTSPSTSQSQESFLGPVDRETKDWVSSGLQVVLLDILAPSESGLLLHLSSTHGSPEGQWSRTLNDASACLLCLGKEMTRDTISPDQEPMAKSLAG